MCMSGQARRSNGCKVLTRRLRGNVILAITAPDNVHQWAKIKLKKFSERFLHSFKYFYFYPDFRALYLLPQLLGSDGNRD